MTVIRFSVCFLVLNILWTSSRGDVDQFCDIKERCILPCTFEIGDEVVIHWILLKSGQIQAHSYYHSKEQFGLQDQRFSGRTSLFIEQITEGNASLQLTGVKLQDEGRYKCYTSTTIKNQESYVNLKVEVPVQKVDIQLVEDRIVCSSEGIYPEPKATWSTTPPSNMKDDTRVEKNETQLYSISSSLILSDRDINVLYTCTISTPTKRRTATLSKIRSSSGSSSETKIPCGTSKTPQMDLIWKFNHSQIIMEWKRTSSSYTVSEGWKQQVKDVSESGDITLKDLSSHHEGTYTCELSDAEVTSNTILELTIPEPTEDTEVSCVFMERCILPCSFQVGPHVVIYWTYYRTTEFIVHLYDNDQDQLQNQHQMYRSRTSLFKDQISTGNASLQLTGVKVEDEGRYECFTRTNNGKKTSYMKLKVYAPVQQVNIQQVENRIICSSEGIYPEPELTWSTTPPSNINLHNTPTVQQNEQQLYYISCSLILSHSDTDLVYSCIVSTPTNRRRAAWRKLAPISGSTSQTIITCAASDFSFSHLVWRFNHSQMILNQSRTDRSSTVSEEWKQQVKDVSESGDIITLKNLSSDQEGIYTCELSDAEETLITETSVKISGGNSINVGGIIIAVIGAVLVAAAVGLFLFYKKKKGQQENGTRRSSDA